MPLWNFVCGPGISKCVLSSNDPCSNLSLFYSIPKGSEGCENRPVESHASAASCIMVGPLSVTHENAILSSMHFFCQPIMYFLVLLILKTMNYTTHFFKPSVCKVTGALLLQISFTKAEGTCISGRKMPGQSSDNCQLPTACTGIWFAGPSRKTRIVVIDFT